MGTLVALWPRPGTVGRSIARILHMSAIYRRRAFRFFWVVLLRGEFRLAGTQWLGLQFHTAQDSDRCRLAPSATEGGGTVPNGLA